MQAENNPNHLARVLWVPGRLIPQILDFYTTWVYPTNLNLVMRREGGYDERTESVVRVGATDKVKTDKVSWTDKVDG